MEGLGRTRLRPEVAPGIGRARLLHSQFVTMRNLLGSFISDEGGEDLIEYGLLSSFVAAVALATVITDPIGIKSSLVGAFGKAAEALYMSAQTDLTR